MSEKNKPDLVLRDGSLKATVWNNRSENGSFHTVTLAKTYEDQDGKLQDTSSFYHSDLLRIAELGRDAYTKINDLRREQSRTPQQQQSSDRREEFREKRNTQAQTREHPRER